MCTLFVLESRAGFHVNNSMLIFTKLKIRIIHMYFKQCFLSKSFPPPPAYSSSVVHLMLLALCSELHDGEIYVSLSVLLTTESVVSIIVLQTYSVIILSIICIILCYYIILYILNMQYVHKTVDLYTY